MSHLDFTVTFPSTTGWTIVAAKLILAPGSVDKFSSSLLSSPQAWSMQHTTDEGIL